MPIVLIDLNFGENPRSEYFEIFPKLTIIRLLILD